MMAWGRHASWIWGVRVLVLLQPAVRSVPERLLEGPVALGHPALSLQLLGYF